jgi:ribonuclease Z
MAGHPPQVPELAFTGDTTAGFLDEPGLPEDVLKARLLIMEMSFLDDSVSVEDVRGHVMGALWDLVRVSLYLRI